LFCSFRHLDHAFEEDLGVSDVASAAVKAATAAGEPLILVDVRSTMPEQSPDTLATSTINSGLASCGMFSSTQPTSSAFPAFDRCRRFSKFEVNQKRHISRANCHAVNMSLNIKHETY